MNKKAFTLIELLAVIVILAIIALIAVPIIINIITDAKVAAFKETANAFVRAGKYYYNRQIDENESMFEFPKDKDKIEIDDKTVTSGNMTITSDGDIMLAISDGTYCARKSYYESTITVDKDLDNCYIYKINGATKNDEYMSFDGVDDYVDLGLKDYDFKEGVTYAIRFKFNIEPTNKDYSLLGNWETAGGGIGISNDYIYSEVYVDNGYKTSALLEKFILDTWYTVVATYDNNTVKMYINGNIVGSIDAKGTVKTSPFNIIIGANPDYNNSYTSFTNMDVESVSIYDRAITEEEITNGYTDEIKVQNTNGLLRHIDFK